MLVDLVAVAPAGVRLPHLDERVRDRAAVLVENPAGDDDPLAHRLARELPGQVAVEIADRILAEHRAVQRVELLREGDERPLGHPPPRRAVSRVVDLHLRPTVRVVGQDDRRFGVQLCHQSRPFVRKARRAVSSVSVGGSVSPHSSSTRRSQPVAATTSSTSTPA